MKANLIAVLGFVGSVICGMGTANALVYDETIDGDLRNNSNNPSMLGTLSLGSNLVTGNLAGDPQDDTDNFSFIVPVETLLSQIIWTYDLGDFSSSGNAFVRNGNRDVLFGFNFRTTTSGSNVLSTALNPGNFSMEILAFGGAVGLDNYSFDLQLTPNNVGTVPLPAAGWMLLCGITALSLARYRRST